MTNSGYWDGSWQGTGIAPPSTHPPYRTPGTPSMTVTAVHGPGMQSARSEVAVGLRSVDQLTLGPLFSGLQGITEGYNLVNIGRINNHSAIPGNK